MQSQLRRKRKALIFLFAFMSMSGIYFSIQSCVILSGHAIIQKSAAVKSYGTATGRKGGRSYVIIIDNSPAPLVIRENFLGIFNRENFERTVKPNDTIEYSIFQNSFFPEINTITIYSLSSHNVQYLTLQDSLGAVKNHIPGIVILTVVSAGFGIGIYRLTRRKK